MLSHAFSFHFKKAQEKMVDESRLNLFAHPASS